ncbi:hypothetical protein HBI82_168100 [Parastagonospora nodorum]|nr:hypothetical protein HBH82_204620 [Parastagonospora nodorum]KAH4670098.1 hypothetical protein HBH78_184150 [Parastagonospora nodorum]KAH4709062.1 hypothetical protein HBH67_058350 [Parastagonospora nodorum]KAH4762403.1 hypothetical protein HBH63_200050 [Parastagonospora nodorum]KAH4771860.1 hypothetical protein HBH62_205920 [Parastagonospora nodorum]
MNDQTTKKTSSLSVSKQQKLSDTSSSSPVIVPTPSVTSEPDDLALRDKSRMDSSQDQVEAQAAQEVQKLEEQEQPVPPPPADDVKVDLTTDLKKARGDKKVKRSVKKSKHVVIESSSSESSEDSDSESESSSEDEKTKRKRKQKTAAKRAAAKKKQKAKAKSKKSKSKKIESSSDDASSSDSESELDVEVVKSDKKSRRKALKPKAKKKKTKKAEISSEDDSDSSSSSSDSSDSESESEDEHSKRRRAKAKRKNKKSRTVELSSSEELSADDDPPVPPPAIPIDAPVARADINTQVAHVESILVGLKAQQVAGAATPAVVKLDKPIKKNALEFKRVDQVFDMKIRDWKLVESNNDTKDEFDCVFTVRRRLNWEGKYQETQVDIKSKVLRNCLQEVFKECKSISLVEDTPQLDPHTLFHYYDELKAHVKKELKPKLKRAKKSKDRKLRTQQIAQCKLLLRYLDEDYTSVRKALKPMLKAGTITYDLVWALFKPNTIAFTPTYANKDDPRCFRVDFSYEYESWLTQAKSLVVDGRYLEYDGKHFGLGDHQVQIQAFKGHKKITSLSAYPLKYHKDPEGVRKQLIERGKKFVALQGMNYRLQKGIAYMKHKNSVVRFNINGRVMIDPAIFRRINPNYQLSYIKHDELEQDEEGGDEDDSDDCCCEDDDEEEGSSTDKDKLRMVMWKDSNGTKHPIKLPQSVITQESNSNPEVTLEAAEDDGPDKKSHVFTEEELLIASPVVLGFAFSEKYWLEFSLAGIEDIKWNPEAFESLVLPDRIKQNLKGLVSSHRFNAAKTIDDVIQGKGKGLNVVLHGPPGVGKTLTGESIAEYLKCPLYAVSAGELGTNSKSLEQDLNRIMDITHSWGAILLLDEADVFLEARQPHDIHRNSLVSVFLRLTEYYQGILFLTTNRVETFDEAFQSRIHMGIRYENLPPKARKKIWQHHVGKVEEMAGAEGRKVFSPGDFEELSKRNMNGRQIKNTVKTSQSIALAEKSPFSMEHVKRVLEVAEAFEDDMRGGKGYRDAMRHYT